MIKVLSLMDLTEVELMRDILADEGIDTVVLNKVSSIAPGVPMTDIWPELWVRSDADAERAVAILARRTDSSTTPGETWSCPNCGELLEPQFAACWKC